MMPARKNLRAGNYVQVPAIRPVHATYAIPCHLWHKWHIGVSDPFSMPLMPLLSIRQEWKWHEGQGSHKTNTQ